MNMMRYKDQNKKNYKFIKIVLFVLVFILFFTIFTLKKVENEKAKSEIKYENLSTLEEVIEYHKSKYISENYSTDINYDIDVYVEFCKPLYEGETSNEPYYNKLLEDCAKVINYRSFRLFDEKNKINIKVICKNSKISSIIINDIEDYFIFQDSQISLGKYEEIPITEFSIQSEILQRCIDNKWSKDTYLGERDSIFDGYYIFFDEGIKARIIDGEIYNIIFTKKYNGNVIENFFPGIEFKNIESTLGKPTFQSSDKVIGYKGEKIYIFFTKDEISVYRNFNRNSDEFFNLADKYIAQKLDLLEFMNELTYLWPDYEDYKYTTDSIYITYPLKGIEIRINSGDINGILVYNNNKSSLSKIGRYLEKTIFVSRLQQDLVFEAEKKRVDEELNYLNKCNEYEEKISDEKKRSIGSSMDYKLYPELDSNGYIYSMNFISKDGEKANRELNDGIHTYLWISNDYFLYSKESIGIYFYNLNTGRVQKVFSGNDLFTLKEYKDGILKYDDKEVEINFQ